MPIFALCNPAISPMSNPPISTRSNPGSTAALISPRLSATSQTRGSHWSADASTSPAGKPSPPSSTRAANTSSMSSWKRPRLRSTGMAPANPRATTGSPGNKTAFPSAQYPTSRQRIWTSCNNFSSPNSLTRDRIPGQDSEEQNPHLTLTFAPYMNGGIPDLFAGTRPGFLPNFRKSRPGAISSEAFSSADSVCQHYEQPGTQLKYANL